MMHRLEHTLEDTWLMFPILYISYLVIEIFERRENNDDFLFHKLQKLGPLVGALVGILPQCGMSIIAAMLYLNRNITLGTLLSVFIATSDEAIPILLANPSLYSSMLWIIVIKFVLAVIVGYLIDKAVYPRQKLILFSEMEEEEYEDEEESTGSACPCCYTQYPIWLSALLRSLKIYSFLFVTTLVLDFIIHEAGEEGLSRLLLQESFLQPVIAAIIGFIPNCAASVVLTGLYTAQQLSFASLISGLISNAGLGIIVLIRYQASKKDLIRVITILFISAVTTGILLEMFI